MGNKPTCGVNRRAPCPRAGGAAEPESLPSGGGELEFPGASPEAVGGAPQTPPEIKAVPKAAERRGGP